MLSNNKILINRICQILIACVLISIAYNEATGKPLPPVGAKAKLYNDKGKVAAGLTKKMIEEHRKSRVDLDADVLDDMYGSGSIFEVENNTKVLIIGVVKEVLRAFINVQILGGKHDGETAWVTSKDIIDINDKELVDIARGHTNNKTSESQVEVVMPTTTQSLQKKQFNSGTGKGIILNESTKARISTIYNIGSVVTLKYDGGVNLYKDLGLNKAAFKIPSGTKARIIDAILTPKKNSGSNIYRVEVQDGKDKYSGWVTAYVVYD